MLEQVGALGVHEVGGLRQDDADHVVERLRGGGAVHEAVEQLGAGVAARQGGVDPVAQDQQHHDDGQQGQRRRAAR